jgi:hypothetical protein
MYKISVCAFLCIILVGCATPERRAASKSCEQEAFAAHPPVFERMMIEKTKTIKVPTGDVDCTTMGTGRFAQTTCKAKMRDESIPYVEMQDVDINKFERRTAQSTCADKICYARFGNSKCE